MLDRDKLKLKTSSMNKYLNKSAVGWDIKLIVKEKDISNPFGNNYKTKIYPITALISKNYDKYNKTNNVDNVEYKLCKIFKEDLINIGLNVDSLKKINATIKIDNGNVFQITNESLEGFNKELFVLEIERRS